MYYDDYEGVPGSDSFQSMVSKSLSPFIYNPNPISSTMSFPPENTANADDLMMLQSMGTSGTSVVFESVVKKWPRKGNQSLAPEILELS